MKVSNKSSGANAQRHKQQQQEGYVLDYVVKRRIPLDNITEIKLSEYRDNFFLICVTNDYATLVEVSSKTEAISVISKNYQKKTNHPLPITFGQG